MPKPRRKRCSFCGDLYWPDLRAKGRQWSCSKPACQVERRKETQRRWRKAHPEDASSRRYRAAIAAAKAGEKPALPRAPPAPIASFPWEEARDEISGQVFVTLRFFVHLATRLAQDVIRVHLLEIPGESRQQARGGTKDETDRLAAAG